MFKKKNKDKQENLIQNLDIKESTLGKGARGVREFFAPSFVDRSNPRFLQVEDKYVKSFIINGYPSQVWVGWLNDLYNYSGDADVALYIDPADERSALDELTDKITQFEAQLATEREKGNIRNVTKLDATIKQLYAQRVALEQNYEKLFYIQTYANLYCSSEKDLNKESETLLNKLRGKSIGLTSLDLRQYEGYLSALPYGKPYTDDMYRNFSSGALTACFPFYNSEISHENGVFLGINTSTNTPMFIDFYNKEILDNSNATVFGTSGSGKTFFVSLLTLRSALKGIKTAIVDPEGEYVNLSRAIGGTHIYIAPDSETTINPFDIEEEEEVDDEGHLTGREIVRVRDKIADVLNLIAVMSKGINPEEQSLISAVLARLYMNFGITEDPRSLYVSEPSFNPETGEFVHSNRKKLMPTFSDFHDLIIEEAKEEGKEPLKRFVNTLKMFRKEGLYGMFDTQTSENINLKDAPLIVFDVSRLEENLLRPIGMYVALSWIWEKFVKKDYDIYKRVVADEAWQLVNPNMAGHEYTEAFLDKAARRIRKRNAGLLIASQSFAEFADSSLGSSVLKNSALNIFLKQSSVDLPAVQELFVLSDGEKDFLDTASKGEMLVRIQGGQDTSVAYALGFDFEVSLIKNAKLK